MTMSVSTKSKKYFKPLIYIGTSSLIKLRFAVKNSYVANLMQIED